MEEIKNKKLYERWKRELPKCDKLIGNSAKIVISKQSPSATLLQRELKVGYNRAGKLIDTLEYLEIIGPFIGSKSRDILISENELNTFLEIFDNTFFDEDIKCDSSEIIDNKNTDKITVKNEMLELKIEFLKGNITKEKYEKLKYKYIYG